MPETLQMRSVVVQNPSSFENIELLRQMIRIRVFELTMEKLFLAGKLPGFLHVYIGEEAVAVGACSCLTDKDYITSTHRGHGHAIAKGAHTDQMAAELFGKRTGYCKGKGGSMHVVNFEIGMLGANGIVGGGFGIAVGAGIAANHFQEKQVAICFFGDGASNKGEFHEAMNIASVLKLPVIFLCENNHYAQFTSSSYSVSVNNVADRAPAYNMPGMIIDGNDVLAVRREVMLAVDRARSGEGPTLIEAKTYRWRGHFVGDPMVYRSEEELEAWKAYCPIKRLETYLLDGGSTTQETIANIWAEMESEMEAAVKFAEESPFPEPEEALEDL
jgi:TPP-dependent pyruvate/acetoin dehydrogenase alpha subunit